MISKSISSFSCSVSTVQKPESSSKVVRQCPFMFVSSGDEASVALPVPVLAVKGAGWTELSQAGLWLQV